MRYTACHYGQFENLLSVNKTRERRMPLASYARASGALCRNERLELGARAPGAWVVPVARSSCASGCGSYRLRASGRWAQVALIALAECAPARCETCSCAAHVASREMRILRARCLEGCGCPRWAAAIRMNLRWPSDSCLRLARAVLRLLAVAVPAPRFPRGGFHLCERDADVRA